MTERTTHQEIRRTADYRNKRGQHCTLNAFVRHDDRCSNGHNTFSITGQLIESGRSVAWGMLHDDIRERIPELAPFLKWHLVSTDGPLHYIANTTYWARKGNLEHARSTAVWPEAALEQLLDEAALRERLPALLAEFRAAVESLGLEY